MSDGARGDSDRDDLFDLPSEGDPQTPSPERLLGPGGLTTSTFTELNHRAAGRGGFPGSAESDAALGEFGGVRRVTENSSIQAHGRVTIPSEGGPDSQRSV